METSRAKADFESEVRLISNVHHRNLVRLLGCSRKGSEFLLVYEYMANGSLDKFLFGMLLGSMILRHLMLHTLFSLVFRALCDILRKFILLMCLLVHVCLCQMAPFVLSEYHIHTYNQTKSTPIVCLFERMIALHWLT